MSDQPKEPTDYDASLSGLSHPELEEMMRKYGIDIYSFRDIKIQDLYYLLSKWPFLQIANAELRLADLQPEVQFVEAGSGWLIHDYGDALSSSPGRFLLGNLFAEDEEGEGDPVLDKAGVGTIVNQAFVTATQMVEIAKQQGWQAVQFIDGHPLMARAAWIQAEHLGMKMTNFEPSKDDIRVQSRVDMSTSELDVLRQKIRLG